LLTANATSVRRRSLSTTALFLGCAIAFARATPADGQFGLPDVVGGAKNLAVKQALSQFGQSLGGQLPIVVADGDAYPTVPNLPGAPFRPSAPPANLITMLRASSDGTVALAPGDYAIGVNVFCMRISAHSPAAYRYLVAPLKGAAADIVQTLNARAPALRIAHAPLQILSWNIQAGLPYASMQPAQRAIVDRVVPEFRARLSGDALATIRGKFSSLSSIPGMPSFDDALSRLGPLGQSVLTMESVRQQMLQPPTSFAQMAQSFVPISPASTNAHPGIPPWSRYSDRVYVRFVTTGGYADPGTYDVRVLPATVSVASTHDLAYRSIAQATTGNVPMTNIVNNPGTGSVQPLTQGPSGSDPSGPQPTPTPSASIASLTVATSPSDRSRTTIGVGEQVDLTFSGANATWSGGGASCKLSRSSGKTNILIAGDTAGACTIGAVDTSTQAAASLPFTIVAPIGIHNVRTPVDSMIHDRGWPNSGFNMTVYLTPDTVSFENLEYEEGDVKAQATGYFMTENGEGHMPKHGFVPVDPDVVGKGSPVSVTDQAYSGKFDLPKPFVPGMVSWNIPVYYRVVGHSKKYKITDVLQISTLATDGIHLETIKGDENAKALIGDPNVDK
jgi:hypothetical protein